MPLSPGTTLGQYEVVEAIGAGGMGEVYRARDTKLGRDVAIKVLTDEFSRDKERLDRFEREAKLLAQVNHANIATLHGLEEHEGRQFLVMELVEGETLAERISRGPIPLDEAIPLFIQIAEGLEAAHEKTIVHRDLKPANIKLGSDGKPKILDFGLAKAVLRTGDAVADSSQSPTLTKGTALGAIMGTASYMSPEQARGHDVDHRTDVWSFGCCLYEALTGKKAFAEENVTDTLAAVLREEPDMSAVPRHAAPIVERCLRKNLRHRTQHIGDVRLDLQERIASDSAMGEAAPTGRRHLLVPVLSAIAGALVAAWLVSRGPTSAPTEPVRFSVATMQVAHGARVIAVSPEGSEIVYASGNQLFQRSMNSLQPTPLPGANGSYTVEPFFSPDGQWIGFTSGGALKKVGLDGGAPVTLTEAQIIRGGTWSRDGTIVYATMGGALMRISADGGEPDLLKGSTPGETYRYPWFLPGGETLLFSVHDSNELEQASIFVLSLDTGETREVLSGAHAAQYLSTGHLLFARNGALHAVAFDPDRLEVRGEPVTLDRIMVLAVYGTAQYAVSTSGTLAYLPPTDGLTKRLIEIGRNGNSRRITSEPDLYRTPRYAPDAHQVAVELTSGRHGVRILDLVRGTESLVTTMADGHVPEWHPGGRRVSFVSDRDGPRKVFWKSIDGNDVAEQLTEADRRTFVNSWSPDGKTFAFSQLSPATGWDIWVSEIGHEPRPLVQTPNWEQMAAFSPDGKWIAYTSFETGRQEVYLTAYPAASQRILVSTEGGSAPAWSQNGELFYRGPNGLMGVEVRTEPELELSEPYVLFDDKLFRAGSYVQEYDVSPDGQRFVFLELEQGQDGLDLVVVLNWLDELERLVPTNR